MNKKDWFVIASTKVAIIFEEGRIFVLPEPSVEEISRTREALATGSKEGARTFAPGQMQLSFEVASGGPVLVHEDLPESLRDDCLKILEENVCASTTKLAELLESGLRPKPHSAGTADEA